MFKLGEHYDQLVGMIIRPPRFSYQLDELGPRQFIIGGTRAKRFDFELVNARKLTIQCSHFEPVEDWGSPKPCVIYLHGNGGGRLDALDTVRALIPCGMSVFALDFAGSGLSEGEYVSLGYWEKQDVAAVVEYLRGTGRVTTIGLWGRSMGAVTALLYSREDPSVAAMVLDSPFCSLQRVAEELVCGMPVPTIQKMPKLTKFAVGVGLKAIRSSIKKKANFDLKSLEVLDIASECFIPSLFVHGELDTFVRPQHSEDLFTRYGGDKNRIVVDGDHNSMRPAFFMDSAVIFFNNTLFSGARPVMTSEHTLPKQQQQTQQTQQQTQPPISPGSSFEDFSFSGLEDEEEPLSPEEIEFLMSEIASEARISDDRASDERTSDELSTSDIAVTQEPTN